MDQVLHLQQIVQLPGVKDGADPATLRSTVPTGKPIRQQPLGLKMRFRPIGFGTGKTGNIGSSSSSTDGRSSGSISDEEFPDAPPTNRELISPSPERSVTSSESSDYDSSSSSDVEMIDTPPHPSDKASKSKRDVEVSVTAGGILKRKHSEEIDRKAKNSSSQSTAITNHKQLKR